MSDIKIYRCGTCGTPTDKDGNPLSIQEANQLTKEQLNLAILVQGYCCIHEEQEKYIIVTREMALDAGDPSLEGQVWRW
jgi:hypothetical protein